MQQQRAFTLIEITVVLVIASLLLVVAVPNLSRLSASMAYREAVRNVVAAASSARLTAIKTGQPADLLFMAERGAYRINQAVVVPPAESFAYLPEDVSMTVTTAAEVSPAPGVAAIRFYPNGGSTGGDIQLARNNGGGVLLQVGWLLGDVRQQPL